MVFPIAAGVARKYSEWNVISFCYVCSSSEEQVHLGSPVLELVAEVCSSESNSFGVYVLFCSAACRVMNPRLCSERQHKNTAMTNFGLVAGERVFVRSKDVIEKLGGIPKFLIMYWVFFIPEH
ncbi:hypothetical protein HMPREF3120_11090 [Corynebacterium sp. HMSC11D10]|nr:hypothetical protein HMPREF3120_11090 [Corynebacterium sp. HMSC11D10]